MVLGNVYIGSNSSLESLNNIQFIGGNLSIDESPNFESFGTLKHLYSSLNIYTNRKVTYPEIGDYFPEIHGKFLIGSDELKDRYEEYQKNQKSQLQKNPYQLTSKDIGTIGFDASVDDCDKAQRAIESLIEEKIEKIVNTPDLGLHW